MQDNTVQQAEKKTYSDVFMSLLAAVIFGDGAAQEMANARQEEWLHSARTAAGDELWNDAVEATRAALESRYGTIDNAKRALWPRGHYTYLDAPKQESIFDLKIYGGSMTDEQYRVICHVVTSVPEARGRPSAASASGAAQQ